MSAGAALSSLEVDLEDNTATAELRIDEVFDENGELRLFEDDDGWSGYVLEDGAYYHVNTWRDVDDPARKLRVGEFAVRMALWNRIEAGLEGAGA